MANIEGLKQIVENILVQDEQTRGDDNMLYAEVCCEIAKTKGVDLSKLSTIDFLLKGHRSGFPTHSEVTRVRRKLQEQDSSLEAPDWVKRIRQERERLIKKEVLA